LNIERSKLLVNSGYNLAAYTFSYEETIINKLQAGHINSKGETRLDQLTFIMAMEYVQKHKPRVVFLGLGKTDDYAHDGRYDLYLQQANKIDAMLAELWNYIQTTPGYSNNTSLFITTDHGRGKKSKWVEHGTFFSGSSQTWLGLLALILFRSARFSKKDKFIISNLQKPLVKCWAFPLTHSQVINYGDM